MKRLLSIVGILLVVGIGSYVWYLSALGPVSDDADRQIVGIEKGTSVSAIADLLAEKGVIRSALAFKIHVRLSGRQGSLQAGSFSLRPSMSTPEVVDALAKGFAEEAIVTIPEGYTVRDIDALLAEKGIAKAGAILECARTCAFAGVDFLPSGADLAARGGRVEGYLYPDTYYVLPADFEPEAFLKRLLSTFEERVIEGRAAEIAASGRSPHEIVTMASLIEKETRTRDERPVVSGILWKRLEIGMTLGVDAAVRYFREKDTAPITTADLDADSPYNLRKVRGLTPGPIANPGMASLAAAIKPEDSPYLYYLHGDDGHIRYARTNDEHNLNRAKYIR